MTTAELEAALTGRTTVDGQAWLDTAVARVRADPGALGVLFPAVGRRCGRGPVDHPPGWTVEDAARALLLLAAPLHGADLAAQVEAVYWYGDAAERRGVLRALPLLAGELGDLGLPLVHDALRTNDVRLVAAALGPYAADRLDDAAYRHGVLKCVFVGVPLASVSGVDRRCDREMARMLADFARERVAAGRDVPPDIWPLVDRHPDLDTTWLDQDLRSAVPARRAAAQRAMALRGAGGTA